MISEQKKQQEQFQKELEAKQEDFEFQGDMRNERDYCKYTITSNKD